MPSSSSIAPMTFGWLQDLVDRLNLPECAIFAWDARGHGRSPGVRGDAPSFGALVRDLDCFARHIADAHGIPIDRIAARPLQQLKPAVSVMTRAFGVELGVEG